ncbi:hypothetical protein [Acidovorax sp. sic0104]|uniref:hypothetical protein n=1 Tax=Acidovorax sp. sic0104 TaxID=2854784 RepID=UPI001C461A8F|nr:hypothetical protein [Acidovorax sp. sic0104]MBV7542152.1 hypothetical protein [Acidovorax sp. sic0104]
MAFEKVLFCFALFGSACLSIVIVGVVLFWSKLQIMAVIRPAPEKADTKDEAFARALQLLQEQTLAIESLKDHLASMTQRMETAEAALAAKPAAEAEVQAAAPAAGPAKAPRRRTPKSAAVPAEPIPQVALPSLDLHAMDHLTTVAGIPVGAGIDNFNQAYPEAAAGLQLGSDKFEVVA